MSKSFKGKFSPKKQVGSLLIIYAAASMDSDQWFFFFFFGTFIPNKRALESTDLKK